MDHLDQNYQGVLLHNMDLLSRSWRKILQVIVVHAVSSVMSDSLRLYGL